MPVHLTRCIACPSHPISGFPVKIPALNGSFSGAGHPSLPL